MVSKKLLISLVSSLFLLTFVLSEHTFSGTTGKIAGYVKDAESGEPLPGANVIVEGTTLGAAADIDGYYFIINVPPGKYKIKAMVIGYQTTLTNVTVTVDLTTKVNISLTSTVVDLGKEVTVTAERPLIEPEVTSTRTTVTSEMIQNMPIRSVQEVMTLQSGVQMMDLGNKIAGFETRGIDQTHVRGGRSGEIAYMVDGMYVEDAIYAGMGTNVNREAIQEVSYIIGGFDAEYGEAQSAIMNIVTKEGAAKFNIVTEFNTGEIAGLALKADDVRDAHEGIGSISGPVPFIKNMTFFLSGRQSYSRYRTLEYDDHTYDPTPMNQILDNPNDPRYRQISDQIAQGIITEVDDISKLRDNKNYFYVGDVLRSFETKAWRKAWRYREDWDGDGFAELHAWDNVAGWRAFGFTNEWDISGKLAWRISPSIKIVLPFRQTRKTQRSFGGGWEYAMAGRNVLDDRTDQQTFQFTHTVSPKLFYDIRASRFYKGRTYYIHGEDDHILQPGHPDEFSDAYSIFYGRPISVDFGPQEYPIQTWHNGFYDNLTFVRFDTLNDGTVRQIYRGATEQYWARNHQQSIQLTANVTWQAHRNHQFKFGAEYKTFGSQNKLFGQEVSGIMFLEYQYPWLAHGYPSYYHLKPRESAIYIQDKMEFQNFIVNAGLRFDFSDSKGQAWTNWDDPTSGVQKGRKKQQVSPRLGLGFPITEKTSFRFNYGHFFQVPDYRDLYTNQHLDLNSPSPFFGWAHMDAQRTIQYELGLDHQLADFLKVGVVAWAKENNGNAGSFRISGFDQDSLGAYSYGIITNNDFGSSKGIDLALEKRTSDNWFFDIKYTYSVAKANQYYSWAGYWEGQTADTRAKKEYLYIFDTPHNLTALFGFQWEKSQGPKLFGIKPLENLLIQGTFKLRSGYPYTPTVGGQALEPNTARRPTYYTMDAVIRKDFYLFGKIRAGLIARISNLMDRKNVLNVYSETGSPTQPNPGFSKTNYSTNWDFPYWYGPRRSIDIGIRLEY